jgi:hypothetical protein
VGRRAPGVAAGEDAVRGGEREHREREVVEPPPRARAEAKPAPAPAEDGRLVIDEEAEDLSRVLEELEGKR